MPLDQRRCFDERRVTAARRKPRRRQHDSLVRRGAPGLANVGDPAVPGSHTLSMIDLAHHARRSEIAVRGRTRWAVFDPGPELFYVNIAQPAEIVVVDPRQPDKIARSFSVPRAGPHGLDLDGATQRLPQNLFTGPIGVNIGCVEEVDPKVQRAVNDVCAFLLGNGPGLPFRRAERHGVRPGQPEHHGAGPA